MRRTALILAGLCLAATCGFAGTTYSNFIGYSPYWQPLGSPNTATYGETFTAPASGEGLESFGFYLTGPSTSGNIRLGGYIATWTGSGAGTLLYSSPVVDYANTGNAELTFSTGGIALTPGEAYVAFLSVSEYYGESSGLAQASAGDTSIPGGTFVYFNNGGDFASLFTSPWDANNLKPDWAFTATFGEVSSIPEPASMALIGCGLLALGVLRRYSKKA